MMELDDEAMMEMCTNGSEETSNRRSISSGEPLNIEAYAALYKGRTKIMRLLFIADHCGENSTIQVKALEMAYAEIRNGEDTQLFRDVVSKINGALGEKYGMDSGWCESVDRLTKQKKKNLENDLNSYRTSLIKDSIRMGFKDFGDFYYACGLLKKAFKHYIRTLDFCKTANHIIQVCMKVILVSIEMGEFTDVTSYVDKATSYVKKAEPTSETIDPTVVEKLRCASGLAHLELKNYKLAALKFLEVNPALENSYSEVIVPQDVARYAGLCALASFDPSELKEKAIDSSNFQNFLELVPEVKELINDFGSSRYVSCLENLGSLKAKLLLDIHLHDHVDTLYDQIRKKALIQYSLLSESVDLNSMADALKTSVSGLENELKDLIADSQIKRMSKDVAKVKSSDNETFELDEAMKGVVKVKSSDNETFELDEAITLQLKIIADVVQACTDEDKILSLTNIEGKIFSKVVEYCKKHVDTDSSSDETTKAHLKKWDAKFMEVDQSTLFDLMKAADYLDIPNLLDLTIQTVVGMIKGKKTPEIRATFNIKNSGFTPEEEERNRKDYPWAFE